MLRPFNTKLFVAIIAFVAISNATRAADPAIDALTALKHEYYAAGTGIRHAATDAERRNEVERMRRYAERFVTLMEKHAGEGADLKIAREAVQVVGNADSAALITWETSHSDFAHSCSKELVARIVRQLKRDHLKSKELGPVIDRMRYGYRIEFAEFLKTVLRENPHHQIKAEACLALAHNLKDRRHMIQLLSDRQKLAAGYEIVFGKDYVAELNRLGKMKLDQQIEALFERATREFSTVKARAGTVGEQAKQALYEIRHLGVDKPAPDIEGKDEYGVQFKLSDYRGKVVLLYFWNEY